MTRILCVEDNDDNVFMLHRRLSRAGFEVIVAHDGAEGVALAASERPDLIVMDLNLPVLDGWEATRQIKSRAETKQIPIIVLSGHSMPSHREKALAAGADAFESKPVNFESFVEKVRALLGPSAGA